MPALIGIFFTAFFSLIAFAASDDLHAQDVRNIVTFNDSDYAGFDLRTEKDIPLSACQQSCLEDPVCKAFTYNSAARWCFLKSDFRELTPFTGAIAGRVEIEPTEQDLGAAPPLDILPSHLTQAARRYKAKLAAAKPADEDVATLIKNGVDKIAKSDGTNALVMFEAAASVKPDDVRIWLGIAEAALITNTTSRSKKNELARKAVFAAYSAYQHSRTASKRAKSLKLLARGLARTSEFRPSLEAYKKSLELLNDAVVRSEFTELRKHQGFRVVNHSVDSDSRVPRICVQFSEELKKKGVDYTPYVQLNGSAPQAVEAKGQQICVDGLSHGETYRVVLRSGLPAALQDVGLLTPVTLQVYVRDRKPSARFAAQNYVLPNSGRHGLPLTSVNTSEAKLDLYRVGNRGLTQLLEKSKFLSQLDGYDVSRIEDTLGTPVWSGKIEIESKRNKDVTTSIPIDEALPERKPGVYLLTAQPPANRTEKWHARATQWFVISDIGLAAFAGEDGLNVFVRSLNTAKPLPGVKLQLLARNNDVLGESVSDENGRVTFTAGLTRGAKAGAPALISARKDNNDFVFLDLTRGGFDLSDRGVTGRKAPGALDVFTWTERGIYRAGETVHVAALIRDRHANAVENLPLTFRFLRPDGVEERRMVSQDTALGGHFVELQTPRNAMRGTWKVRIHTDPKSDPVAEQSFLVEDFVPDRLEFDLSSTSTELSDQHSATAVVNGRFLYGAPAAGLSLAGELRVSSTRERADFKGYMFGLADEEKQSNVTSLQDLPLLDEKGNASFIVPEGASLATTQLQKGELVVRLRENGGRAIERSLELAQRPQGDMIGIRPGFSNNTVGEKETARFDVVAINPAGEKIDASGLKWSLAKLERHYQWYQNNGSWRYEPVVFTRKIADGTLDASATGPVSISHPVTWGRYRLEVATKAPAGPASSFEFNAGWFVDTVSTETPDGLEIALDKASYAPGETARLTVSPRFAGEMLVTIGADELRSVHHVSVPKEGTIIDLPIGENWGAGAYVTATMYRPGSARENRMPMRAVGVKWLKTEPGPRVLTLEISPPEKIASGQQLTIPVKLEGHATGESAFVALAAVDVGILNLTSFKTPDPGEWFFGQRQLGIEIRDIYGRLIDGSQGAFGRIRSGGDTGGAMQLTGSPPTEKLVSLYSGPVEVDKDGRAMVTFDVPDFNGTVQIMAVAWSPKGVGKAEAKTIIRNPVVLTASAPEFLAPEDKSQLLVEIANTDGPAGDYVLDLVSDGAVALDNAVEPRIINLAKGSRHTEVVKISGEQLGRGNISIRLTHSDGLEVARAINVSVRSAVPPVTVRKLVNLPANGGQFHLTPEIFAGSAAAGTQVTLNVSRNAGLEISSLLRGLDQYPYGCAEQTTSKALPLLYLSELSQSDDKTEEPVIRVKVQNAIHRVLSYQSSSGSFGLWSPSGGDLWLDAYVTDFLTRAREKSYLVPDHAMLSALQNIQNVLAYQTDIKERGSEIAYALYVLARNKRAAVGNLRYYFDAKISEFTSPMSRAHLAASLALYGDGNRANRGFLSALKMLEKPANISMSRSDYGSELRDGAAVLALAAETMPAPAQIPSMVKLVSAASSGAKQTSTQEKAWMLLAARAIQKENKFLNLEIDGVRHQGSYARVLSGEDLLETQGVITNLGDTAAEVAITVSAIPNSPPPAGGYGFTIERTYYSLDGKPVNITNARQNERFVAVLTINEENQWTSHILVSDLLPAGFEIDNPSLVKSASLSGFEWLSDSEVAHTEFKKDRFTAALNRTARNPREYTLAYIVRAVTPGEYTHPGAFVEDMYRPQFSARSATSVMQVTGAGK